MGTQRARVSLFLWSIGGFSVRENRLVVPLASVFSLTEIIHQGMINSSKSRREEVLIRRKHFSQLLPALETEIDSKPSGSLQEIHGTNKEGSSGAEQRNRLGTKAKRVNDKRADGCLRTSSRHGEAPRAGRPRRDACWNAAAAGRPLRWAHPEDFSVNSRLMGGAAGLVSCSLHSQEEAAWNR